MRCGEGFGGGTPQKKEGISLKNGAQKLVRTVPTVPVPLSTPGETVPTAPNNPRSGVAPANQRKGQNGQFTNFAHFCEFWCFSLGKQARFTLKFCSGMPLRKVHELTFLWFGLPGPLLTRIFTFLGALKIGTRKPKGPGRIKKTTTY